MAVYETAETHRNSKTLPLAAVKPEPRGTCSRDRPGGQLGYAAKMVSAVSQHLARLTPFNRTALIHMLANRRACAAPTSAIQRGAH